MIIDDPPVGDDMEFFDALRTTLLNFVARASVPFRYSIGEVCLQF
jgi:hypothetical protein